MNFRKSECENTDFVFKLPVGVVIAPKSVIISSHFK